MEEPIAYTQFRKICEQLNMIPMPEEVWEDTLTEYFIENWSLDMDGDR